MKEILKKAENVKRLTKMNLYRQIFLILAVFLLSDTMANTVSAESIMNISMQIIGSNVISEYNLYSSERINSINLEMPQYSQILDISADNAKISFEFQENHLIINQSFNSLVIQTINSNLIESNSKRYFTLNQRLPQAAEINVKLILPESAVLNTPDSAYPTPVISTDGQHIIIDWSDNLNKGESFSSFVVYKEKSESLFHILISIAAVLIALILAALIISRSKKRKEKKLKPVKKEKKEIKVELMDNEKKIISVLKKAHGELWQKQIQLQTGFSKAKLSRLVRDLESRSVIKKIPMGNTNKIRLS